MGDGNHQTNYFASPADYKNEAFIEQYLHTFLDEMQPLIEQMLALSTQETVSSVNPPSKIRRYITLPPSMPSKHDAPQPESDAQIFDSFLDAFEKLGKRVLLLGGPGAGKTTTLLQFACDCAQARLDDPTKTLPIPIFVSIHRWEQQTPLPQWLQFPLRAEFPNICLEKEHLLYILDGLDEMGSVRFINPNQPEEGTYDPRMRFLSDVKKHLPAASVVISCRELDYQQIGEKAALSGAVTLLPLEAYQVESYLNERNQSVLWSALAADTELLELVRTPLLLALLSKAVGKGHELLPMNSSQMTANRIFDFYIEQRFLHESLIRALPFNEVETREMLGKIGAGMWKDSGIPATELTISALENIVGCRGQEFVSFALSMNFIRLVDSQTLQFIHSQFRDYCAIPVLMQVFADETSAKRWDVVDALGKIGDVSAVPALTKALIHEDYSVRLKIVDALGEIKDASAIPALIQALKDEYYYVRRNAADALGKIGDVSAVPALIEALNDEDGFVVCTIADALSRIGDALCVLIWNRSNQLSIIYGNSSIYFSYASINKVFHQLSNYISHREYQLKCIDGKIVIAT